MFLYLITNTINGKRYIGQTRASLKKRWINHCSVKSTKTCLANAIHKYGRENFTIEALLELDDPNLLNELEAEYIQRYCSLSPNGYNIKAGGKVSALHPDTKAKLRLARLGKPLSEDHKQKIGAGVRSSEAWKIGNAARNKVHSPESRAKMSASHKGKPRPWKVMDWTSEQREERGQKYKADGNPNSLLTWDMVDEIRELYAGGNYSQTALAAKFNIGQAQVSRIVLNRQWVRNTNAVEIEKAV